MKKITLLGHSSAKERLTKALQEQGLVEITSAREDGEGEPPERVTGEAHNLELAIHKTNFLIGFLSQFQTEKKPFIAGMMSPRVYLTRRQYETIEGKIPFDEVYEEAELLDERLQKIRTARTRIEVQTESLRPWIPLDVPLAALKDTSDARVLPGILPADRQDALAAELAVEAPHSEVEVVSASGREWAVIVLVHKTESDEAQAALQRSGFRPVTFESSLVSTPPEEIQALQASAMSVDEDERQALERIRQLMSLADDLLILRENLQDRLDRVRTEESFYHTEHSFLMEGWAKRDDTGAVLDEVGKVSSAIEVAVSDPTGEDNPPVILENARVFKPFEALTRLYGYPNPGEIDPTPIMGPFFFIFFGMALGDFGYGLVLAIACWYLIRKYDLRGNVKNFMHLLMYGGVGSMLVGIVTGGYFGVELKDLPAFLKMFVLIDPLNQALEFMIVAIMLGVVQVILGVIIEGVDAARHGNVAGAIFDQGTTVFFLISAVISFAGWIGSTVAGRLPPALAAIYPAALVGLGLGTAGIILLQGRVHQGFGQALDGLFRRELTEQERQRGRFWLVLDGVLTLAFLVSLFFWVATFFVGTALNALVGQVLLAATILGLTLSPLTRRSFGRIWSGAYALYGMSGFIGDFLSYARLMALGLATVLIGMVINLLAKMVFPAPYVGIIFGALILLVGHTFNLVINLLSAFVHPTRLQFVEFFSQFYTDGGNQFAPLAIRTRHLIFVPEETSGANVGSS